MPNCVRTTVVLFLLLLTGCAQQQVQEEHAGTKPKSAKPTYQYHVQKQTPEEEARPKKRMVFFNSHKNKPAEEPADIWERLRNGMALQSYYKQPDVARQVAWYADNQSYIDRVMERAELYLYYITEQLESNDMPLELALLPVVESAYDPFAYSNSHASGLWQFIPDTGSRFGLRRDWWYDGRRDPIAATEAAISYLQYLHNYFDQDWLLALAAYNCGEGNVRRAIEHNRSIGKPTDFWSLKLPRETRGYVPQLLAISRIVAKPGEYSVTLPSISNSPYFNIVEVPDQLDLKKAAELASMDSNELYRLNAGYNRAVTHPEGPHRILVPIDHARSFKQALNNTPREQWAPAKQHVVKSGDTLSAIAKKYQVTVNDLKKQNRLRNDRLSIGQYLKIPGSGVDSSPAPLAKTARTYQVKAGDNLWKIAKSYKVKVSDLAKWNNLNVKDALKPGQTLKLQQAGQAQTQRKVSYRVKRGDSLYRIANQFDLTVNEILEWNDLSPKQLLKPGQQLTLFVNVLNI